MESEVGRAGAMIQAYLREALPKRRQVKHFIGCVFFGPGLPASRALTSTKALVSDTIGDAVQTE